MTKLSREVMFRMKGYDAVFLRDVESYLDELSASVELHDVLVWDANHEYYPMSNPDVTIGRGKVIHIQETGMKLEVMTDNDAHFVFEQDASVAGIYNYSDSLKTLEKRVTFLTHFENESNYVAQREALVEELSGYVAKEFKARRILYISVDSTVSDRYLLDTIFALIETLDELDVYVRPIKGDRDKVSIGAWKKYMK